MPQSPSALSSLPSPSAPSPSAPGPSAPLSSANGTAESGAAPEAGDLLGLDETALKHWFGAPSFIRRDYPAEVWQYRAKACVLELYLYPADDHMAVTHAEALSGGASSGAAQSTGATDAGLGSCLSALAEARRKSAQG